MAAELTSNVINDIPIHLVVIVHLHELLKKIDNVSKSEKIGKSRYKFLTLKAVIFLKHIFQPKDCIYALNRVNLIHNQPFPMLYV